MYSSGGFRLVVRRGPQPNQVYELNKDMITIGRDITNEITINDPEVSRHHCRLTRGPNGYTLEDLGSTNGTFVNNRRLTGAQPLSPGDTVGLGETVTLAYESNVGGPVAPAASPPAYGGAPEPAGYRYGEPVPPQGSTSAAPAQQQAWGASPYAQDPSRMPQQGYGQSIPPAAPAYNYGGEQTAARGNRGCGVMIGCGIFVLLGLVLVFVGIIVVNSPLDDIPFIGDAAGAVPLPGSSVDNAEKYLEELGKCNFTEVKKYVCSREEQFYNDAAAGFTADATCPFQVEDISCEKDGTDVTCSYTSVAADTRTEQETTFNIRNGEICGIVTFSDGE